MADVALEKNEGERAAKIFGAASALRTTMGSVIDPADQPEYDRRLAMLREKLGEKNFPAAWNEGNVMTLVQAVEYALQESNV